MTRKMGRPWRILTLVAWLVIIVAPAADGQALYRKPSLDDLAAMAGADGVIPQPFLALTNTNVVDVRGGTILRNVTIVLRDGKIESVGSDQPPAGAEVLADPRLFKFTNRPLRGENALREVVRINADHGVDWIKTRSGGVTSGMSGPDPIAQVYTEAELVAIVDEASRFDIPVECRAHGTDVIIAAILAGCRSLEHASYVDDKGPRMMQQNGTIWAPTYISVTGFELPHDDYDTNIARRRWPHLVENLGRMIRRGYEMGVNIVTAVDSSYGPDSVYRIPGEINAFVEFGMSPIDALRAATVRSAEAYELEEYTGTIEAGLDADLLAFDRNPLEQPSVLHNPLLVMSNGRVGVNRQVGLRKVLPNH